MTLCAVQLYTQEFYESVVKAKLNPGGIFVTQSGPAGVMSASQVGAQLTNRHSGQAPADRIRGGRQRLDGVLALRVGVVAVCNT